MSLGSEHLGPDSKQARDAGLQHFKHTPDVATVPLTSLLSGRAGSQLRHRGSRSGCRAARGRALASAAFPPTPGGVPVDLSVPLFFQLY